MAVFSDLLAFLSPKAGLSKSVDMTPGKNNTGYVSIPQIAPLGAPQSSGVNEWRNQLPYSNVPTAQVMQETLEEPIISKFILGSGLIVALLLGGKALKMI